MLSKKYLPIAIAFLFASSAHAQFGNLLNQLKSEVEKSLQQQPAAAAARAQPAGKPNVLSSEEFCSKLKSAPELTEFAAAAKKLATQYDASAVFDTQDKLISNWIAGKLNPMVGASRSSNAGIIEYVYPSEASANECALSLRNSDLLYLMVNGQREYDVLKAKLEKAAQEQESQTVRKMDANGNIVVETVKAKSQAIRAIGDYNGVSSVERALSNRRGVPPQWLVTWLLLLDENGQILKNTYPEIKAGFTATIARLEAEKKESAERWAREKKETEEARAKEDREQQAEINKYREFVNSPDGRLTVSYQYFQVVQTCNEIRKGYAVQFVNDAEFAVATKKIKGIEATLKPALREKNTDKLWANALGRNQKWNPTEGSGFNAGVTLDLIDTIKTNNKSNWSASQKDCAHFFAEFNDMADTVLGKDAPKKAF